MTTNTTPLPARFTSPLVDALCIIEDVADQVESMMWPPVADALHQGATLADIADAMHEEPDYIVDRLICWADGQEMAGRMTEDEGDALREALHAAGGPAPIRVPVPAAA